MKRRQKRLTLGVVLRIRLVSRHPNSPVNIYSNIMVETPNTTPKPKRLKRNPQSTLQEMVPDLRRRKSYQLDSTAAESSRGSADNRSDQISDNGTDLTDLEIESPLPPPGFF